MAGFFWLLVEHRQKRQGWKKRVKLKSPCRKAGKRGGWVSWPRWLAVEELRRVALRMPFEGFPDGLDEEWERKQAIKNVSRASEGCIRSCPY